MAVHIVADSLTTAQVRAALVAHNHAIRSGEAPRSICATDCKGMAFVGLNGPEAWRFESVGLTAAQAVTVAAALADKDAE